MFDFHNDGKGAKISKNIHAAVGSGIKMLNIYGALIINHSLLLTLMTVLRHRISLGLRNTKEKSHSYSGIRGTTGAGGGLGGACLTAEILSMEIFL